MLSEQAWIALILFVICYAVIISEKVHRTKVALIGAIFILLLKIMSQEEAIKMIDFNTIGLLVGMMIIVSITSKTGLFQYMALKSAKLVNGNPLKILVVFFCLTAACSALLDNVTTVLLFTSVTFAISDMLQINPIPFLIAEILASNIGGTATLIGDPPNIMIGSATGLGFNDFAINLIPPIVMISIVTCLALYWLYRKDMEICPNQKQRIMTLEESSFLVNIPLMKKCIAVLCLTIGGFVLHQTLHLDSATVAMAGAAILLLVGGLEPEDVFKEIEWNTIFFFIGLFILVGGLEITGIIRMVAHWAMNVTQGNTILMHVLILWLSAIGSAFVDNIPFVATMIPLIKSMGEIGHIDVTSLWWTLSLGACLGGNGTLIGASANVVVSSLAAAHGRPISFIGYMKIAFPLMILSIIISNIYIYFVYL
ncbi:ArsB/NhaD family transporter [Pelosinus sp. IPA-1]|uniref:SLC13 family permease n=1 Tax=Pelosinus sp. IPA-1 TaxID=3029569 RepID=UPI0024361A14|nr:ArsB/NhaD family transporter [Pelosinus sp. IPA-1]GMB01802.1 arsenical pump family protein [Pelosinus sp. IPA-1]